MSLNIRNTLFFSAYIAGYVAILLWFKWVDVYHNHFATAGLFVLTYNIARIVFVFYLFWIVCAAGALFLRVFGTKREMDAVEPLALYFFSGASLWHIALLALGYLNLYNVPVAVAATAPFVALSWPLLVRTFRNLRRVRTTRVGASVLFAMGVVVLFGFVVLIVKGLYPGTNHDYMTHYFQYYQAVIREGGLWPNEVWYHYYYSKGAGLFFLGILLTDPLAPQLVTFCFVATAASCIYLMLQRGVKDAVWPWIGAALYLSIYIDTPLWGEFEKHHEINSAMIIAVIWMSTRSLALDADNNGLAYIAGTILTIIGATIHETVTGAIFVATFGLASVVLFCSKQFMSALFFIGFSAAAGMALVVVASITYLTTGIFDDHGLGAQWKYADFEKINELGWMFYMLLLHFAVTKMSVGVSFLDACVYVADSLRRFSYLPFLVVGSAVSIVAIRHRIRTGTWPGRMSGRHEIILLLTLTFVTLGLAITSGLQQPVSFFRFTSYVGPVFILLGILLWNQPIAAASPRLNRVLSDWRMPFVLVPTTLVLMSVTPVWKSDFWESSILARSWRFATGEYSIDSAYSQPTLYYPNGGIHPAARSAYAIAGASTPIRMMNVSNYCMLPDCRAETPNAVVLGPALYKSMYGSPEEAREALKTSGNNYFLYTKNLALDDFLQLSALFSPDNISKYLGVRWTDGNSVLLTWLGPDTKPLDEAWLADYRKALPQLQTLLGDELQQIKSVLDKLDATPHPWRSVEVPWQRKIVAARGAATRVDR